MCDTRRQRKGELDQTNDLDAGWVILSIFQSLGKKCIFYVHVYIRTEIFRGIRTGIEERIHRKLWGHTGKYACDRVRVLCFQMRKETSLFYE